MNLCVSSFLCSPAQSTISTKLKCHKGRGLLYCLAPRCVGETTMWLVCLIFLAHLDCLVVHSSNDLKYWWVLVLPPGNCSLMVKVLSICQYEEWHRLLNITNFIDAIHKIMQLNWNEPPWGTTIQTQNTTHYQLWQWQSWLINNTS